MPELPEVETICRQLDPVLRGRRLESIELLDPKLELPGSADLAGCSVRRVERLGKRVGLEFQGGSWLTIHLRMTGRLLWLADDAERPTDHVRALLRFAGGELVFHDVRRFGTLELHPTRAAAEPTGLDPLGADFTVARLGETLADSRQQIKVWLLRQDRLVGLGNIYAAEILFDARISPHKPAGELSGAEIARLHASTVKILTEAVRPRGTSLSDYRDAGNTRGGFQEQLRVYGRAEEHCPRCGAEIVRCIQCQRSTFYCPHCQADAAAEL